MSMRQTADQWVLRFYIYGMVFKPLQAPHLRRSLPAQPTGALFCLAPCADATPDLKHTGKSI